jgi:thiol-disulfide isomerase/thioredoxin
MSRRQVLGAIGVLGVALVVVLALVVRRAPGDGSGGVDIADGTTSELVVQLLRNPIDVAPFTVTDLDGRTISSDDWRGKVVLVNFWATWCPPCREEIPDLIALQARYKDHLQIIGIAQDSGSVEDVKRFAAAHRMNYPTILSTPEIERLFPPVSALPTSFFLDKDGRLAQKHIGMLNASLTELETQALAGINPDLEIVNAEDEDKARVQSAAQANKIPGVDLAGLTPEKRAKVLETLNSEHCSCGCGLTVAQCRVDDPSCTVSLPLAQQLVEKVVKGK